MFPGRARRVRGFVRFGRRESNIASQRSRWVPFRRSVFQCSRSEDSSSERMDYLFELVFPWRKGLNKALFGVGSIVILVLMNGVGLWVGVEG